jgi:hypothetical protein
MKYLVLSIAIYPVVSFLSYWAGYSAGQEYGKEKGYTNGYLMGKKVMEIIHRG